MPQRRSALAKHSSVVWMFHPPVACTAESWCKFQALEHACAVHAEKQSIVVNGELTPTIEVTRGQVLEVGPSLARAPCCCGTASCGTRHTPVSALFSALLSPARYRIRLEWSSVSAPVFPHPWSSFPWRPCSMGERAHIGSRLAG